MNAIKIKTTNQETGEVIIYRSISETAELMGVGKERIYRAIKNGWMCHGCKIEYAQNHEEVGKAVAEKVKTYIKKKDDTAEDYNNKIKQYQELVERKLEIKNKLTKGCIVIVPVEKDYDYETKSYLVNKSEAIVTGIYPLFIVTEIGPTRETFGYEEIISVLE